MLVREVLSDKISKNTRTIPVPRCRNIYDVSGLYLLQQSLVIGNSAKMIVRRVLSDRWRITQDKFQHFTPIVRSYVKMLVGRVTFINCILHSKLEGM